MELNVVVPYLAWPPVDARSAWDDLSVPSLTWLLSRGTPTSLLPHLPERWLVEQFGLAAGQFPVAALTLQHDAPNLNSTDGSWLRADPVYLRPERDQLVLADSGVLSISQYEANELILALNTHFAEQGLQFIAPAPDRWYVSCMMPPTASFSPLTEVIGQNILPFLPQGEGAKTWHVLMNEIQMLLFNHPINEAREAAGDLPINSVWLWGEGALEEEPKAVFDWIWGDEVLTRALGMSANIPVSRLPAELSSLILNKEAKGLLVLDQLAGAGQYEDIIGWREGLLALENGWFYPLKQLFDQGEFSQLNLFAISPTCSKKWTIEPSARWKFWRNAALSETLGVACPLTGQAE